MRGKTRERLYKVIKPEKRKRHVRVQRRRTREGIKCGGNSCRGQVCPQKTSFIPDQSFQCFFWGANSLLPMEAQRVLELFINLVKVSSQLLLELVHFPCIALISQTSKVMLKILQARLQQYMNRKLPNFQAGFRKGRGTRDQIANIRWIIKKAREFQKNIYFCFIGYAKAFDCVDHSKLENSEGDRNTRPPDLPLEKPVCRSGSNSQNWTQNNRLVPNRKRSMSRLYIVTLLI